LLAEQVGYLYMILLYPKRRRTGPNAAVISRKHL